MDKDIKLKDVIEVALLTSHKPLSVDDLQKLFTEKIDRSTIRMLIDELKVEWNEKTLNLIEVASGYRFEAKTEYVESLMRMNPDRAPKYSRAVLEVLAIIAYRQPVTRGDIESIRGVALNPNAIRQLTEREWIDIVGIKETPGRPALYGTTKHFLNDFGLKSLAELPDVEKFEEQLNLDLIQREKNLIAEDIKNNDDMESANEEE
ncbi:MAG: SMC-Scp complex subunit ScpB [Methylophilaceae bacterium]|jgi:segregation and condensation protein B